MVTARRRTPIFVFLTAVVTILAVVIARNFIGGSNRPEPRLSHLYSTRDSAFLRAMGLPLGPSIVAGNRIAALLNGDEIFPAMLRAIGSAQKTITVETYIYWAGEIGDRIAAALAERARAGVKVHVLVDWAGSSKIDEKDIEMMQRAGVEFRKFRPLRWYNLARENKRTHRKLLVVDGRIGFIGGVGIAEMWTGNAQDSAHWRDSHFQVEGPVVAELQAAFMDNWMEATGAVLHGDAYFPPLGPAGTMGAQVFSSSPTTGNASMELMYVLAITAAEHSIDLSTAYFVPDETTENALIQALKRGVTVRIITPGTYIDTKVVRRASRARWGELLAAGAGMYEYEPTMYHCKVFLVDDLLTSVGSSNWDPRSFGLNDETNLNIYDAEFARRQRDVFQQDLSRSHRVTLEQWRSRSIYEKLREHLAAVFSREL